MIWQKFQDKIIDSFLFLKSPFYPCPFGKDSQAYWLRRKEIFSNWDNGIQTDGEGLFSAKPAQVSAQAAELASGKIVIDACCGIGATTAVLARSCRKVYAIEINPVRLNMARHNAEMCDVGENIEFLEGDALQLLPNMSAEAVLLDPPWGGINYSANKNFGLADFRPSGLLWLKAAFAAAPLVLLMAPPRFDVRTLAEAGRPYRIYDNFIRSKLYCKTIELFG